MKLSANKEKTREIHTRLSTVYYNKLVMFTKYFKTQKKVIEAALDTLERAMHLKGFSNEDSYWLYLKKVNAIVISKTTFSYLLEGKINSFLDEESCKRALEIATRRPIENVNIKKIIKYIVYNYKANGWFEDIIVEYEVTGNIILRFFHHINYDYSKIISKYFINFFEELGYKCTVSNTKEFFTIMIPLSESPQTMEKGLV